VSSLSLNTIHLCSGLYSPCGAGAGLPAVEIFSQTVVLNGVAYVWVDGISVNAPILLPIQALHQFKRRGTYKEYLEEERHLALDEGFEWLMELCAVKPESATVVIRACEIMHEEGLPADQAIVTAHQWGITLLQINEAERVAMAVAHAVH
jgi:hypothetical protein